MLRRLWVWIGHLSTIAWLWSLGGSLVVTFLGSLSGDLEAWQLALLGLSAFFLIVAGVGTWSNHSHRPIAPTDFGTNVSTSLQVSSKDPGEPRAFLGNDVTLGYLLSLLQDRTEIQGQAATRPFIGKWMRITGQVVHVGVWQYDFIQVVIKAVEDHQVSLFFRSEKWVDPLSVLALGETITAEGRIDRIYQHTIALQDCELIGRD